MILMLVLNIKLLNISNSDIGIISLERLFFPISIADRMDLFQLSMSDYILLYINAYRNRVLW